jgi:hypothetical protein
MWPRFDMSCQHKDRTAITVSQKLSNHGLARQYLLTISDFSHRLSNYCYAGFQLVVDDRDLH